MSSPHHISAVTNNEQWQLQHATEEARAQALVAEWNDAIEKEDRLARFAAGQDASQLARRLYAALQEVRLLNPAWHESEGRRYYLALLRRCRAQPPHEMFGVKSTTITTDENEAWQHECLATCYYQLQMYPQWEQQQRALGLRPARDIEKALRWDGKSNNSGRGNAVVREYLNAATKS